MVFKNVSPVTVEMIRGLENMDLYKLAFEYWYFDLIFFCDAVPTLIY